MLKKFGRHIGNKMTIFCMFAIENRIMQVLKNGVPQKGKVQFHLLSYLFLICRILINGGHRLFILTVEEVDKSGVV